MSWRDPASGRRRWLTPRRSLYALALVSALVLGAAWAVSSPAGSAPDDDFHLSSIWCAAGSTELCQLAAGQAGEIASVQVPRQVVAIGCLAGKSDTSGSCVLEAGTELVGSRANNGLYPPIFYSLLGNLASQNVWASVVAMRLAVLCSILLAFALSALAAPMLRDSQLLAWALTSVPLGLFMFTSTNPSSWGIAGVAAAWPAAWGMFDARDRRGQVLAGIAMAYASLLAMASRSDTAVIAAVVLVAVAVVRARGRRGLLPALVCVALATVGVGVFLTAGQSDALTGSLTAAPANRTMALFWSNLLELPALWTGVFGVKWGLGWLDTPVPAITWTAILLAIGGIGLASLQRIRAAKALMLLLAMGLAVAVPMVTLTENAAVVGTFVQPRYVMPLIVLFVAMSFAPIGVPPLRLTATQRWLTSAGAAVAASMSLHFQIRRYTTGIDIAGPNLDGYYEWWQAPVLSPMGVWLVGTLAGALLFAATLQLGAVGWEAPGPPPTGLSDGTSAPEPAGLLGNSSEASDDSSPDKADSASADGPVRQTQSA